MEVTERQPVQVSVENSGGPAIIRPVGAVARAPSAFMDLTQLPSPIATCAGRTFSPGYAAIIRNEDGSLNACGNPAPRGSVVTFYLNGIGRTAPSATLNFPEAGRILALEPDPDSPLGVWRMVVRLSPSAGSGAIEPVIDGVRLRYGYLAVWVVL